mmetsp:Transcript_148/g.137  ORF Transcript_148/g.137 Transcript_148/m.137 type:complete len:88 (+) Transcript_148:138-401(+)
MNQTRKETQRFKKKKIIRKPKMNKQNTFRHKNSKFSSNLIDDTISISSSQKSTSSKKSSSSNMVIDLTMARNDTINKVLAKEFRRKV